MEDDDAPRKKPVHELGTPLDTLSVDELQERITMLAAEIERLRQAIEHKSKSRDEASTFFKL